MNSNIRRLSKTTSNREVESSRIRTTNPIPKIARKLDNESRALLNEARQHTTRADQDEIARIRRRNLQARNRVARRSQELE